MRYRAFLSYSHADRRWARWLHRALESWRTPKNLSGPRGRALPSRLKPIFRDRDELPTTSDLSSAVNEALGDSEWLIVVCSPSAAASKWVNEEIRIFRRRRGAHRILCFIVDGDPGAGAGAECFPAALTESEAGTAPEPVAADARPNGDGRKNALLKLISGLLGVGFDALKQRELRRRYQRMAVVTAGSLTIAAVTIWLAITAIIAQNDAEFRRTQAEDLVDFMLGDLTERLHEIGRLDIYESIGDRALEYFAEQRDADVSDRTLAQRARNLMQIGEVRMDQADLAAALVAFEESLLIMTRLAERNPDNGQIQIGLANSHFYVGHVQYLQSDLTEARHQFEKVLPIVSRLAEEEPNNTQWLMEVGFAHTNLGRVLELEGLFGDALHAYEQVMIANKRLVELEPDNPEWQLEVGFAHNNIGLLVKRLGRLDEAEAHFRADLQFKRRVFGLNTSHNTRRNHLGVSQYYLGQLLVDRGLFGEAAGHLNDAYNNFDFLLEIDPDRTNWLARQANIERALAQLDFVSNSLASAMDHLESSITELSVLSSSDRSNADWRRDLVRSLLVAADYEARLGNDGPARRRLDSAVDHLAVLVEQESGNRETRELAIYADICKAQSAPSQIGGDSAIAYASALEKLDSYFDGTSDPRILELRVAALRGLERTADAELLRERLRGMGYRGRSG